MWIFCFFKFFPGHPSHARLGDKRTKTTSWNAQLDTAAAYANLMHLDLRGVGAGASGGLEHLDK